MTDTLVITPQTGSSGSTAYRVLETQFGDGYSQALGDGINTKTDTWNVKVWGIEAYVQPIKDFLDDHKGATSFFWTPPLGVQGYYRCKSVNMVPDVASQFTLTFTLEQKFMP